MHLSLLAEAYGKLGNPEAGLSLLGEAFTHIEKTDERFYEAELCRLQGELLLKTKGQPEPQAEVCFQQAIEVARRQEAKLWELRATVSLARLWQRQGKSEQARQMLAQIYGWFTEGFDTADLQETKRLLDDLSV